MQKYLHLLQIVETEKTVAKRLRQQIEDQEIEVERLKAEVGDDQDWVMVTGARDVTSVGLFWVTSQENG